MYISLSFGFSLLVNVWVFFRVSGGLFVNIIIISPFLSLGSDPCVSQISS
jgi:aquaporin related protein